MSFSKAAKMTTLVFAGTVAVGSFAMSLVFGFVWLAASSDAASRGCPEAVQCEDSDAVMLIMAWVSPTLFLLSVAAVCVAVHARRST
ncbi:hypothetical protein FHX16_004004 [Rhizobium sp. BK661]|nr:hypothetical protein [Rhizobium sp. BK661]